jgi:hypothetical protein
MIRSIAKCAFSGSDYHLYSVDNYFLTGQNSDTKNRSDVNIIHLAVMVLAKANPLV